MPPQVDSRYRKVGILQDNNDILQTVAREPYRFRPRADNGLHQVVVGDTLENLAARFYVGKRFPGLLYWVIGDYQPDPILDPSESLAPGRLLVIPSPEFVSTDILGTTEPPTVVLA